MRVAPSGSLATNYGTASPGAGLDIHSAGTGVPASVAPASMRAPLEAQQRADGNIGAPTYEPGRYGDIITLVVVFAGAGDLLVLPRPAKGQRSLLIIENDFAAGTIRFNWDAIASATVGIPLGVGGNAFFDTFVPQNDLHIFGPGAGTVQINYAIQDITSANRIAGAA